MRIGWFGLLFAVLSGPACGGTAVMQTGDDGVWSPCDGRVCGADCTPCDPSAPDCVLPGTPFFCDANGVCDAGPVACTGGCSRDDECAFGSEWCVEGACVPCDNSGEVCDLGCPYDWGSYARNGCSPCACAPRNECTSDAECGVGTTCYAGAFCWCDGADPGCCQGNTCSPSGCAPPSPAGCVTRGCPQGDSCEIFDCAPSSCSCDGAGWSCTEDCGGGVCVTPL